MLMLSTITSLDGNGWLFYLLEKSTHFYPQYGNVNLLLCDDLSVVVVVLLAMVA